MYMRHENRACEDQPADISALIERATEFYVDALEDSPGMEYLSRMNLADPDLLALFRVGYCCGRLTETLPDSRGDLHRKLTGAGILLPGGTERFEGCITFPVLDIEGCVQSVCGLNFDTGEWVFLENASGGLWNGPALKEHPELMLAATPLDGLALQAAGYANACAVPAEMTPWDWHVMVEAGVNTLIVVGPKVGIASSLVPSANMECIHVTLPGDATPSALMAADGPTALSAAIDRSRRTQSAPQQSTRATEAAFRCRYGGRPYEVTGISRATHRLKATVRSESAGRIHVDTIDFFSAKSRRSLCRDLCRLHGETPAVIEADVSRLMRSCEQIPDDAAEGPVHMSAAEREEAEAFGRDPDLVARILRDYETAGLVGERANKLLCYLAAVSRKMAEPLSLLLLSSSGAGKSALQEATLRLCPPEDVVKLTSLSGKALFYKAGGSLRHKILALEEQSGAGEAAYAIRTLISSGELTIETAVKDLGTGKLTTMKNRVQGPTAVFVTTTDPDTDPETRSRFLVVSVDESREQTRAILRRQRERQTLAGQALSSQADAVVRRHRNFQRLLEPLAVVNPLVDRLEFSDDRLRSRREQPRYLNLIAAVAFLRQMGREKKVLAGPDGPRRYVEVNAEDVRIATELACEVMGRSLGDLNAVSRRLLRQIEEMVRRRGAEAAGGGAAAPATEVEFSRRDIREHTGWPHTRVTRYIRQLIELEYLIVVSGRFGQRYRYRLACGPQPEEADRFLPGLRIDNLTEPDHHLTAACAP